MFAAGDSGYGTIYPADLQYVTAVGGTTLRTARPAARPWTETAWGSASRPRPEGPARGARR